MTNYELLRWLVETLSRDIRHYRMLNASRSLDAMLNRDVTMHHCNWWALTCGLLQLLLLHYTLLTALCPGLPGSAGTRKVKPIWILLKQETVSGSGISWAICKSASHSRQRTTPAPHHSVFYRPDALPAAQPTASKHWRQIFFLMIRRPPRSTRKESSAASDVYKRQAYATATHCLWLQ